MKIYQHIAKNIEDGLNNIVRLANPESPCLYFSVKDMYDTIEQDNKINKIAGVVSYKSEDILPITNLNVYTTSASVALVCAKEWADTVIEIVTRLMETTNGIVQTIGGYAAIPTYSTPTHSEIGLIGQIGEALSISFDCSYVLIKNGILSNQIKVTIDAKELSLISFEFDKTRSCPSSNKENGEIVTSNAQTQAIALNLSAILTSDFEDLIDEIMSRNRLAQTHDMSIAGLNDKTYSYKVCMENGVITGQMGGAVSCNMAFLIAR